MAGSYPVSWGFESLPAHKMKIILIPQHALDAAASLGIDMPEVHLKFLVENRIRKDFKKAINSFSNFIFF